MAVTSIVDYLKSQGKDSSYSARKKLAEQAGIQGYSGTASQNINLLKQLQNGSMNTQKSPSPAVTAGASNSSNQPIKTSPTPTADHTYSYQSTFVPTELTSHYKDKMTSKESNFSTSGRTNKYKNELDDVEDSKPGPYQSAYESTINEILNTIKNKGQFDVKNDANYNALYDQYRQKYEAQANKAMMDTLASANAATGGYGSTYGQAVAQQAYDNTMQGLNGQNMNLLNLAYQMYSDDRANDYNKLTAYQGQDNTMYGRYRDTVSDWQKDRDYYANQYQQNYSNDRNAFENDRSYFANQYWNSFQNDRSAFENDRAFNYGAGQDTLNREDTEYQNAMQTALELSRNGLSVPSYLSAIIDKYNSKKGLDGDSSSALAQIRDQALALKKLQTTGSSRSGGSKSSGSSGRSSKANSTLSNSKKLIANDSPTTNNQNLKSEGSNNTESNDVHRLHNRYNINVDNDGNTTGWVEVFGIPGRMTWPELESMVDSGKVIERKLNSAYYYIDKDEYLSLGDTNGTRTKALAELIKKKKGK